MNCSNHAEIDAVAICAHCGRALCQSCTCVSNSGRASCSPACENELMMAKERSGQERRLTSLMRKSLVPLIFMAALAFVGASIAAATSNIWRTSSEAGWLLTVFPLLFAAALGGAGHGLLRLSNQVGPTLNSSETMSHY